MRTVDAERRSRRVAFGAAVLSIAALAPPAGLLSRSQHRAQRLEQRAVLLGRLTPVANTLADVISRRLALNRALRVFVETYWGSPNLAQDFTIFASGLQAGAKGIRALELMPRGVCEYVFPLAGNESMLGHNMFQDEREEVLEDLRRALHLGRVIVNGPLELRQGGQGLLAREAVFVHGSFWGFVTTVLDLPPILEEAGLKDATLALQPALRDTRGRVFFGSAALFAADSDAVVVGVKLPEGTWDLAAAVPPAPRGAGWWLLLLDSLLAGSVLLAGITTHTVVQGYTRMRSRMESDRHSYLFVAEELPGLVATFDSEGRYTFANRVHLEWFGCDPEGLVGRPGSEGLPRELWREVEQAWRRLHPGERVNLEVSLPHPGHGARRLAVTLALPAGQPGTCHMLAIDTTEVKRLEERLQQTQRLESVGRLAGGVAHDFNNMLTVINGYCELVLAALPPDDRLIEPLSQIQRAGQRAGDLTQQLLAFSRKQVIEPRPLSLNEIVADSAKLLRRLIREDIELCVDSPAEPVLALADRGQVHRILVNLVVNARDAIGGAGRISVTTRGEVLDEEAAARHPEARAGAWAALDVVDSGTGMSAEVQRNLFEPFFTTKAAGSGTGLGLATTYGVVRQMGGWIEVESTEGRGSRFSIFLPRAEAEAAPAGAAETEPLTESGRGTVLVVEDQDDVRQLTLSMLRQLGYRTLEAVDGASALDLVTSSNQPIDLLLTDVLMPGMTGRELAQRLEQLRPSTRVLYMSGYTADVLEDRGVLGTGLTCLAKPFTLAQLGAKLREVLNSHGT